MSKFSKCLWDNTDFSAMESCYKLYTWINDTLLMLLLQLLWKMSQISDYFKEKPIAEDESGPVRTMSQLSPLTKASKLRRHIRSMSDVQSSTPYYRLTHKSRKASNPALMYDSDTRERKHFHTRIRPIDSSDSSDFETVRKMRSLYPEGNLMKHSDSMRIL